MKRAAPIDLRRKKNAYREANPLLPENRSKQRQRAFDAARDYFKHYRTPLTDTLQSVFGSEFFGRAALWLDPLSPFRNSAGIIGYENRFQSKESVYHYGFSRETITSNEYTNRLDDEPLPVPEYSTTEPGLEVTDYFVDDSTVLVSTLADSTAKSRDWENSWASGERYDRDIPSFGTFTMQKFSSEYQFPNVMYATEHDYSYIFGLDGLTPFYTHRHIEYRFDVVQSITYLISGPIFEDLEAFALEFMNDNVSDMITNALASRRSFNLGYQVAELKDLPRLLFDIGSLKKLVARYSKDPAASFAQIDKDIANLNLSWEFGVKSLASAVKGLMKLPTRATKRLNYLIARNGKVSTGRYRRSWLNYDHGMGTPGFDFALPPWIERADTSVTRTMDIELRCVVNQTINFPRIAVPTIADKDYRRLIGLPLKLQEIDFSDVYNLIPFSWLQDWFTGLGSYINLMTAVHQDTQLVNFGFLTIVINERVTHRAKLKTTSSSYSYYVDNSDVEITLSESEEDTVFPYVRTYVRKYQRRVDIGQLEGVKSFGWYQKNLSDWQKKILGSLFSQRA